MRPRRRSSRASSGPPPALNPEQSPPPVPPAAPPRPSSWCAGSPERTPAGQQQPRRHVVSAGRCQVPGRVTAAASAAGGSAAALAGSCCERCRRHATRLEAIGVLAPASDCRAVQERLVGQVAPVGHRDQWRQRLQLVHASAELSEQLVGQASGSWIPCGRCASVGSGGRFLLCAVRCSCSPPCQRPEQAASCTEVSEFTSMLRPAWPPCTTCCAPPAQSAGRAQRAAAQQRRQANTSSKQAGQDPKA